MSAAILLACLLAISCGDDDKKMGPTIDEIEIIETDHSQDEPVISYEECVKMAEITDQMTEKATAYTAASQTENRGLYNCTYVYASTRDKYLDNPGKLAARIYLLGFRGVYLSPGGSMMDSADPWLKNFISTCTDLCIDVYATYYEDPEVFVSEVSADACLQKVLNYNRSVTYKERFAGVSADLEPHTIKTDIGLGWIWNTNNGNGIGGPNDNLLRVTLDRLNYARDKLQLAGLKLQEAIWCHYQEMFESGKVAHGDIDQFVEACNWISLMAYGNSTDAIWNLSTPSMNACEKSQCINICVKTATNDEPTTTIQPNGWNALLETMQTLKERGLKYPCFNGLDMFQFDSLETMWEWTNDKN